MARKTKRQQADEGSEPTARDNGGSGTLSRGLSIMNLLLRARQPMTLAEIAEATALDQSTTLRLLRNLEELRQVLRIGQSKKYICSPKALAPLPLLHPLEQLRRESAAMFFEFSEQVRATAVFVIFLGTERLVVQVATSTGTLNPYYNSWLDGPLHGSGPGKALLMSLKPAARVDLVGEEPFQAHTPNTLLTWDALNADLSAAQQRGYVLVKDEFHLGLSAMARNIKSSNGHTIGCIVLTGHTRDFTPEWIEKAGAKLINLTSLLPMQVASLATIDTLCGR